MQVKRKTLRASGPATRLGLGLTQASSVRIPALLRQTRRFGAVPKAHPAVAELAKEPPREAPQGAPESTSPLASQGATRPRGPRPAPLLPPLPTLPSKRRRRVLVSAPDSTTVPRSARYLPPGFRLAAYTVLRRSNEGGTCEIYHVCHPQLSLRAIARVARPSILKAHPWIRARMLSNAEIIAESNHTNLMRILDFGETGEAEPRPFVITERIVGRDLAAYLASHGQVPVPTVIDIGLQITRGLLELHRLGLSHGDLKPSNIMISLRTDGSLRIALIDFDLARHQEEPRAPGLSPGTPNYLPPEHSIGMRPSTHFDIYALGVILHELLLGECPVDEQRCMAAIEEQSEWPMICPLHIEHPELGVPRPLSRLIARLTHRDRCRRPKSLAEIERSIERLLSPGQAHAPRDNTSLTLRPSVSDWVNVALATKTQQARLPVRSTVKPHREVVTTPSAEKRDLERPRAILPLTVDAPQHSDATSWHRSELLEQGAPEKRTSPLRDLQRGSLVTMLALGAIVGILSILAGTTRVVAMPERAVDQHPEESLDDVDRLSANPQPEPRTTNTGTSEATADAGLDPVDAEPAQAALLASPALSGDQSTKPARRRTPRRGSPPITKPQTFTDQAEAPSTNLLPVVRAGHVEDESVEEQSASAEVEAEQAAGTEANTGLPAVTTNSASGHPRAQRNETPPVTVPKLTGMDLDEAKASLRRVGIGYRVRRAATGECFFREGTIIAQSFAPGTAVAQNLEITMDYCRDEENEREEEKRHGYATDQRHSELEHQQSP